jgi:hypothetical protein
MDAPKYASLRCLSSVDFQDVWRHTCHNTGGLNTQQLKRANIRRQADIAI